MHTMQASPHTVVQIADVDHEAMDARSKLQRNTSSPSIVTSEFQTAELDGGNLVNDIDPCGDHASAVGARSAREDVRNRCDNDASQSISIDVQNPPVSMADRSNSRSIALPTPSEQQTVTGEATHRHLRIAEPAIHITSEPIVQPSDAPPPKPKHGKEKDMPIPISEIHGGYYYYHVNFCLIFGANALILGLVASETIFPPPQQQSAGNTTQLPGELDIETQVANLRNMADTSSTILLATFLLAVYVRQEFWFISPLYYVVTRTPHRVPLSIRKRMARWVYALGGFHSGAGCALIMWLVMLLVLQSIVYVKEKEEQIANGPKAEPTVALVWNTLLIVLLSFISVTALWQRSKYHNLFELVHRWIGWLSLGLVWALLLAVDGVRTDTGKVVLLALTSFFIFFPWFFVRKVHVSTSMPSSHCIVLEFSDAAPGCGTFGRISHAAVGEYHTFATITKSAMPAKDERKHSMIVAGAGDWTKQLIQNPPTYMWVRSIRTPGFMNTVRLFKSTILVHTGAGIAPGLPYMYQKFPNVKHVIWTTRDPRKTFGDEVTDTVLAMPSVTLWDTTVQGHPDVSQLVVDMWTRLQTEAIHIVANEPVTIKVVSACRKCGVPCFGAIWDS